VADGLFLESGYFLVMPSIDIQLLIELFRVHALKMFKKEGLIDEAFIKIILAWRHTSGFSVHNKVRNTFSLSKLQCNEETSSVIYRSGKRRLRKCLMERTRKTSRCFLELNL